ncbi:hypothetical protein [Mesobacillus jeotgali]|uniref:Uncharacterized protein n=1 Tax=Mesobacillus jeotgali TaxID=129985 RepID=A0ABY9VHK9_9BACI|nr:hypothetical protein [Mesobacillus jeotgali]WNF23063.1 hypothetical protein RH061_00570 [Mesobacillus jeotgali]
MSQLQTGLKEKHEKLSEDEPTLDRFGGKAGKVVRSRSNFRQVWRESRKSCQKMSQLQTGLVEKEEKLSEVEATLDRFGEKAGKVVRSRSNFRQVWRESRKSCQKMSRLQTGLVEKEEKLSEVEATLDRFEGKSRKVVRT